MAVALITRFGVVEIAAAYLRCGVTLTMLIRQHLFSVTSQVICQVIRCLQASIRRQYDNDSSAVSQPY